MNRSDAPTRQRVLERAGSLKNGQSQGHASAEKALASAAVRFVG